MSQIPLRSVRLNARPATALESFVGTAGEIFYDSTNQTLRVYPGNTAAGKILADRDWVNSAIGDIGSSSLVNGTRTVSLSTAGSLTIPGDIRSDSNINIDINLSDSTLRRWQFGEDGELTFPDGYLKIVPNGANPYISNRIDNGLGLVSGNFIQIRQSVADAYGITISSSITDTGLGGVELAGGSSIDVNGSKIILGQYTTNYLDADNGLTGQNKIEINNNEILIGQYISTLTDGVTTSAFDGWTFGTDGTLTLPNGSVIEDSPSYIKLTPAGGANEYQALLIYPTAGDGNHIHLAAPYGGGTELYLGNDLHYVKLATSGNVEVLANNGVNIAGWIFGTDGDLKIPGNIKSNGNINIDINLTDSTLRRWQFGEDGDLTLPAGGNILNSSGQPYVDGVTSISTSVSTGVYNDASGDYQYGTLSYDYAVNGVTSGGFSIEYSRPLVGGNVDINVGNAVVNGDLTLSGDIKSNGNINIDINLADSTLRRWQFGEDGALTFPDGTNQSTAFTGASLPTQTGNSGKFLTTDGSSASWVTVPYFVLTGSTSVYVNQVVSYTINDYDSFTTYSVAVTSGTATIAGQTITFTAPAGATV